MTDIYTWDQLSPEWFRIKLGIVSASSFSKVLAKGQGKTRKTYMLKLAADIITKENREAYQNTHMERGNLQESQARSEYETVTGNEVNQVGFVKTGRVGCSPDGLVGPEGGIEIKSVIPEVQIETIMADKVPTTHKAQIQGCLMICDCQWWDFVSYSPLIKNKNFIFIKRVYPNLEYIENLQTELLSFIRDLDEMVKKMS